MPKGTQINNFITLKPNNSPNQTSISGSNEFTIEDFGQPWDVTQQTSGPHGTTPAGAQQFTEGNNSNGIKLGELIQATSQPWEATQQATIQHGNNPADRTGAHAQADLLPSIYGHDEHHQISTTDFP